MADKRITELDPMIDDIEDVDVFVMTDTSEDSGTGKTVKVRRDQITPSGGTTGQHLVKASNDDFDMEYVDPLILGAGMFQYQLPHGAQSISFAANTYTVIPLNTEVGNRIAGLILKAGGAFTLPVGTFLLRGSCRPYYTNNGTMYLKDETNDVFLNRGYTRYGGGGITMEMQVEHMITVTTPTDYSIGAIVSRSERVGLPVAPYVGNEPTIPEVFATITIQKVA